MKEQPERPEPVHYAMNRNIVWSAPGAVYGFCPRCSAPGEMRERIDGKGKDRCQNKHLYPSVEALPTAQRDGKQAPRAEKQSRLRNRTIKRK